MVNLIDVTLACEDANSKLVEVVTVADVDSEDHVGNSLLQIWEPALGGHQPFIVTDLNISGQGYVCTGIYVAIYISTYVFSQIAI